MGNFLRDVATDAHVKPSDFYRKANGEQYSVIVNNEFFGVVTVTINTGVGAATGFAPTYTETINTGVGETAATGFAPTYTEQIATALGQATATGFSPTVSVASSATVIDTFTGQVSVSGVLAAIALGLQTQEGQVQASGFAPQVQLTIVIQTSAGTITVTGASPSVALAVQTYVGQLAASGAIAYPVINFRPGNVTGSSGIKVLLTKTSTLSTGVAADSILYDDVLALSDVEESKTFNSIIDGTL